MKRIAVLVGVLIAGFVAAVLPPSRATEAQANCFQETGFCITTSQFADYYAGRGGSKTLGFPISRTFTLEGFQVQFFQRVVLQLQGSNVNRLNLLDPGILPITRANQSVFPKPDAQIAAQAPQTSSPTYARDVVQYIQKVSPNTFNGQQVNYFDTFNGAVPADLAFGGGPRNDDLLTLFNLEIWGLPTSAPAPDPGNGGFIYQRYQRGIMHFDASCGCTQGILVGEYLKAVMTGKNLPGDLAADMQGSRYLNQYNANNVGWLARPGELKDTDLTGAFEPGTAAVKPGTAQGPSTGGNPDSKPTNTPVPAAGTATPTPTSAPTGEVVIQVDDDLIDPGQKLHVTVIARNSAGLDWIEWQGDDTGDAILDANHRFDGCDSRTECASGWDVNPVRPGRYNLRARARDKNGVRSDWVSTPLRVRDGPTPTPTPVTPTPTVGPGTPTVTPTPVPVLPVVKQVLLSDTSINLGATVDITVIASSDTGLDWIQWQGDETDDPALDSHRVNCDNRKDCAFTWTGIKPTKKGSVDILGDVKDQNGVRGTTVRQELRVR